jgi:hypothetical protein
MIVALAMPIVEWVDWRRDEGDVMGKACSSSESRCGDHDGGGAREECQTMSDQEFEKFLERFPLHRTELPSPKIFTQ